MVAFAAAGVSPCGNDHIEALRKELLRFTVSLSDNASCAAPINSAAYFFASRNAYPVEFSAVSAEIDNTAAADDISPLFIKGDKILILVKLDRIFHRHH